MTLKFHYKNSNPSANGYLYVACAQDYERFSSGHYQPLPRLSKTEFEAFLQGYNNVVQDTNKANATRKFFSMTPFALRNTWQSSFYQGAENFARLAKVQDGNVHFFSPEWFLYACYNTQVDVHQDDVRRARRDLYKLPLYRLFMSYQGIRFALSRRVPQQAIGGNPRFFMASIWTKVGAEKWIGQGIEPFYGDLPHELVAKGYETSIVYHSEGITPSISEGALNFTSCLKFSDWFCLVWHIIFFKAVLSPSSLYPCQALSRDMATSLAHQLPLALISYFASKNLLSCHPEADFISLYENNCWEQGVLQAVREKQEKVIAFQHTSFSPALLKMDNHIENKMLPDKIITSGDETARILCDVMGHNHSDTCTGSSLRYKIDKAQNLKSAEGKILILLQGVPDDALFLHVIGQSFKNQEMIIRAHPSWPIHNDRYISSQKSLAEDLSQASVVLYTGTTAVFEALATGVPAIHIDLHGGLSADPLFALMNCAVKKTWSGDVSLTYMISEIKNMSDSTRSQSFQIARDYIDRYFKSADDPALETLIKKITHE